MCLDANHFSPKLTIKIEGQVSSETHFSCAAVPDVRHGQSTFLQIDHDPFLAINYDEPQGIQKFMSAPGRNPWQEEPQFCVGPPAPLCVPSCVEAAVSRAVYSLQLPLDRFKRGLWADWADWAGGACGVLDVL